MRSLQIIGSVLAVASNGEYFYLSREIKLLTHSALAQVDSKVACDSLTKICYSSYTSTATGVTFGIALPEVVTAPYDAIISVTAPISTTWAGFSWGGTMVFNPLTVSWKNGQTSVVSSRLALYVL